MSDPATGGGQSETSSAGSASGQEISRVAATLLCLLLAGPIAAGVVGGIGFGNVHGWDWALAGAGVLAAAWLLSYWLVPTPRSKRIAKRLQPAVTVIGLSVAGLCLLMFVASGYLVVLMAPYSPGIQTLIVGSWLVVHVVIIVGLIIVAYHLLFPLIESKRRAVLVWRVAQGGFIGKLWYALGFGLIVSTSIALWDQLLLLLARHDVVRFYQMLPKTGAAAAKPVSVTDLIHGNDIFLLLAWHLGDMVPTLKVNDTIGFEQPLFYTSSVVGWLILAFKLIVGLALIGSVLAIVKAQRDKPGKPPEISLLPGITQRILHWQPRALPPGPDRQTPETADP